MRLPTKPWQTPTTTPTLPIFLASCIAVAIIGLAVLAPRTTSSRRMTLAGGKKFKARKLSGPAGNAGNLVDIEIRGVGGENCVLLGDAVELAEHVLLDHHVLVDRLDDEIAIGQDAEIDSRAKQPHARLDVGGGHPTLLSRIIV